MEINQIRDSALGAQIFLDLGVRDVVLLTSNTRNPLGLEGPGIRIVGHKAIE